MTSGGPTVPGEKCFVSLKDGSLDKVELFLNLKQI